MEVTDKLVAEMWNHLTGIGIRMTHDEIEETLLCATGQVRCAKADSNKTK